MSSNANTLDNASKDANQIMSPAPAGSPSSPCGDAPATDQPISDKNHWIAIRLVDEEGDAVPGEDYRITLPDGTVIEGSLDGKGSAKITGIDPGNCQVTFPNLDQAAWKRK